MPGLWLDLAPEQNDTINMRSIRLSGPAMFFFGVLSFASAQGPKEIPLADLSYFENPASNWKIAGDVSADLEKKESLDLKQGQGILVNDPGGKHGADLRTKEEFGDIDLEFEFMMAKGSNSGLYLQGLYEIQLFDSWGVSRPRFGDCGGVYERWDDAMPEGKKGFEGYAPRINTCRAPGLWQKMSVSFKAPRFDQYGVKKENARLLKVEMNGVVIHQNLELTGPTRGGWGQEKPLGPIRIQGDHGPVAFRNIRIESFNRPPLAMGEMTFAQYFVDQPGKINGPQGLKEIRKGTSTVLTQELSNETSKFALSIKGPLEVPVAGKYTMDFQFYGLGDVSVDGKPIIESLWGQKSVVVELTPGKHDINIFYVKMESWYPNGLAFYISGPGIRRQALHLPSSEPLNELPQKIGVDFEKDPVILRSFVDFQPAGSDRSHRVTHAINVGFPSGSCYTYDASCGAMFQVWRGGFLDATPMWNDRGDGSSRAVGSTLDLLDKPTIAQLANDQAAWPDTLGKEQGFRPKGYILDQDGIPSFRYQAYGALVEDQITPNQNAFKRRLQIVGAMQPAQPCYARLAQGAVITAQGKNLYRVDGRYYIRLPEKTDSKPVIRSINGSQELILPFSGNALEYELIW